MKSHLTVTEGNKVSVICAVYNPGHLFWETVDGLLRQTCRDFEIILIDDASNEETREMLSLIRSSNVRVFRNDTNRNVVFTRNRGINEARGAYIAITDQDDISVADRLKLQVEYLDSHRDVSAVYSWVDNIDGNSSFIGCRPKRRYKGEEARVALLFKNFVVHSTLMFRREAVSDPVYSPDFPLGEDYHLISKLSRWRDGIHPVKEVLVRYRIHDANYSSAAQASIRKYSEIIKDGLLTELGILPTEKDMGIHCNFETQILPADLHTLTSSRRWLEKLVKCNDSKGVYDTSIMRKVVKGIWLEYCHRFSMLGLPCLQEYLNLLPMELNPRDLMSSASLLYKCGKGTAAA